MVSEFEKLRKFVGSVHKFKEDTTLIEYEDLKRLLKKAKIEFPLCNDCRYGGYGCELKDPDDSEFCPKMKWFERWFNKTILKDDYGTGHTLPNSIQPSYKELANGTRVLIGD